RADGLHTLRDHPLDVDHFGFAGTDADPQDAWRSVRRKHADPSERNRHRRARDRLAHRVDQGAAPILVDLAEKRESQVHVLGPHPFERALADESLQSTLLVRNRYPRPIVELNGNKQTHGEYLHLVIW